MGLIRLIFFGAVVLTVVYWAVSAYSRSVRREKLEKVWLSNYPNGGIPAERDAFIEEGVKEYSASMRPKLIALVYVVPAILVIAIHVLTTYY